MISVPLEIPGQPMPETGDILVAEPFMRDDNLRRTVVYLCEVNEDGAYGMVLNHPLPVQLSKIIEEFPDAPFYTNYGGPVDEGKLFYIHNLKDLNNAELIINNQYFGGSFEDIKQQIILGEVDHTNVRFFVGYTGWGKDQLQQEIEEKSWIVWKNHKHTMLTAASENLWSEFMIEMGAPYSKMESYPLFYEYN